MNTLLSYFKEAKQAKRKGGLYHKTQITLAYNSNKIEGSKLTEEQTRYIFETRTIGFKDQEAVPVDDIIETSNHFIAFDWLIDTIDKPLSNDIIKKFHHILKTGTSDATKEWFQVGDWKKMPNEVGGIETTPPQEVEIEMNRLNDWCNSLCQVSLTEHMMSDKSKISIRFFNDHEVRAVWDEENNKWWFSVFRYSRGNQQPRRLY